MGRKVAADLFDIDLFDNPASVVADLHARGREVACYFSAGSFENWRPDASQFPDVVKGRGNGWPGERWLDVRRLDVLGPIIDARLDLCRAKGFDSVDPDNVDAWTNNSGFPITGADQLTFNGYVANAAHARGLSVALKNDLDQIPALLPYFDWAVNEQCAEYAECDLLVPFVQAGKPVMEIEYSLNKKKFCPAANARDFNAYKKSSRSGRPARPAGERPTPRPAVQRRCAVSLKPSSQRRPFGAPIRVIDATSRCMRHARSGSASIAQSAAALIGDT